MSLSPAQRTLRARVAVLTRWAQEDPGPATAKARQGFAERFEREVDPEGKLSEIERRRRAKAALRAHMLRLAKRSAAVRQKGAR